MGMKRGRYTWMVSSGTGYEKSHRSRKSAERERDSLIAHGFESARVWMWDWDTKTERQIGEVRR